LRGLEGLVSSLVHRNPFFFLELTLFLLYGNRKLLILDSSVRLWPFFSEDKTLNTHKKVGNRV
jgi:hypothetical protein